MAAGGHSASEAPEHRKEAPRPLTGLPWGDRRPLPRVVRPTFPPVRLQGPGGHVRNNSPSGLTARVRFLSLTCIISGLGEVARSCARMLSFQWVAREVFRVSGRMV